MSLIVYLRRELTYLSLNKSDHVSNRLVLRDEKQTQGYFINELGLKVFKYNMIINQITNTYIRRLEKIHTAAKV